MTMLIPITVALIGLIIAGPYGALFAVLVWALFVILKLNTPRKK